LPLPSAFGNAFYKRGHQVSAIDFSSSEISPPQLPLEKIYPRELFINALKETDVHIFWGSQGIKSIGKQILLGHFDKKTILASYIWDLKTLPNLKMKLSGLATNMASRFARVLVVMTTEQMNSARVGLSSNIPIVKFTCGIDTKFYQETIDFSDVPENQKKIVESLLKEPYIIMLGDQQRCNDHIISILKNSNLRLVRVGQSFAKKTKYFRNTLEKDGLTDRCFFFEKISYPFLRFLLRNAAVYAGLVDSTWQPAGWTVACEAVASGLPIVLYDGLVARELSLLGAAEFLRVVPMGNIKIFQRELELLVAKGTTIEQSEKTKDFAATHLNLELTGDSFAKQVEQFF
jgi:glycosyltransferase involved in cell wall biosynthesis